MSLNGTHAQAPLDESEQEKLVQEFQAVQLQQMRTFQAGAGLLCRLADTQLPAFMQHRPSKEWMKESHGGSSWAFGVICRLVKQLGTHVLLAPLLSCP